MCIMGERPVAVADLPSVINLDSGHGGRLVGIMSDITSVIGLVQKAKQLADDLKNLEMKEIVVDLQSKMLDLKEEILQLRGENALLTEQVKGAPVAGLLPKEAPTVKNGMYYKGDDGPFCTACYDMNEKLVRLIEANDPEKRLMRIQRKCPACKAQFTK